MFRRGVILAVFATGGCGVKLDEASAEQWPGHHKDGFPKHLDFQKKISHHEHGVEGIIAGLAVPPTVRHDTRIMVTTPRARLGNRLFAIAATISIAKAGNAYVILPDYKYNPKNTPQLSKLTPLFMSYGEAWEATDAYENKCHIWDRTPVTVDGNQSRLLQWTLPGQTHGTIHVKADASPNNGDDWAAIWAKAIRETRAGSTPCYVCEIDGFYQRNEYFQTNEGLIRSLFWHDETADKAKKILDEIIPSGAEAVVAVHLRLGDYVVTNRNLDMSYYRQALQVVSDRREKKPLTCVIFSDDVAKAMNMTEDFEACESRIPVEKWKGRLQGKARAKDGWEVTDTVSFFMMSQIPNIIIADSTYSWWAARLSKEDPFVVAPILNNSFASAYEYLKVPGWENILTKAGMAVETTATKAVSLHSVDSEVANSEWGA